jgi:hypothetical protein
MKPVVEESNRTPSTQQRLELFEDGILPIFIEGGIYWSVSNQKKVKVHLITDTLEECSCTIIDGRKGHYSLNFSDLKAVDESYCYFIQQGDKVKIHAGKKAGTIASVSSQMPS